MAVEYGTIAVVPMGEWEAGEQYEVANLVTLDGSSYIAHKRPPVGTQPTDTTYWQVSAQGASKASESSLGVVKSDGVTTNVNDDGVISVKTASQDSPGIVKGSAGITVKEGGSIDVNTTFKQATELANIIAGEAIAQVLGKVSKSIAVTMGLDQNALLKSMLTNIDTNDTNKVPSAALVHTLYERIGMAAELTAGNNLTDAVNQLNSNIKPQTLKPINGNNQVTLHRMGHLRILQLNDAASGNGGVIGRLPLPTDYPDVLVRSVCVYGNANVGTIYVRYDDGEFGVRGINPSADPITTNIRANVVWTVK